MNAPASASESPAMLPATPATSTSGDRSVSTRRSMRRAGIIPTPAPLPDSPYTSVSSTTTVRLPFEVLKALPAFARDGLAFFKTVGSSSRIWGNLLTNWLRFEQACKTKGVS